MIDKHILHPHRPRNVNALHKMEQASGTLNQKIAVCMTKVFSSMPTFWLILLWIVLWIIANATIARFDPLPWPLLLCLASVPQLPLMIVIMVGQGLLGRHQELQSEEQFKMTSKSCHDAEVVSHQNEVIIGMLDHLLLIEQQKAEAVPQRAVSAPRRRKKVADASE